MALLTNFFFFFFLSSETRREGEDVCVCFPRVWRLCFLISGVRPGVHAGIKRQQRDSRRGKGIQEDNGGGEQPPLK